MVKTSWIPAYAPAWVPSPRRANPNAGRKRASDLVVRTVDELRVRGLHQSQIAEITGMNRKTVRAIMHRTGAYAEVSDLSVSTYR
jgi:hypothetical protein